MKLAIGGRYREPLENALIRAGVEIVWLPDNPDVDKRLAGHADLSVFSADEIVIATKHAASHIVNKLTNADVFITTTATQGVAYPNDASLCACYTGKYLIYNPKTIDPVITDLCPGIPIWVNQGYTKCSVCVISGDAIITSDSIVSRRAVKAGMDVLKIEQGHITLDGFPYGFIGGASFLLDKQRVAFTGSLDKHPDKIRILRFLEKHEKLPVFLTNNPIFDIGGGIPLP